MTEKFTLDFVGIGVERAASRWLFEQLREHPEICASKIKEVNFFSDRDLHWPEIKNLRYGRGLAWYQSHFSHCQNGVKGEFTPTYIYSPKAAKRIKKHFPKAKLIVSLRDPVERAFSHYLHVKSLALIGNISFEEALKSHDVYLDRGFYFKHLSHYYSLFPRDQIWVTLVEDIKKDPKKMIQSLYRFLGLKDINFKPQNLYRKSNVAVEPKLPILNYFLINTEYFFKKRGWDFPIKYLEAINIRKFAFWVADFANQEELKNYPEIKPETAESLRKEYLADIKKLEKLIDRDLSAWKMKS